MFHSPRLDCVMCFFFVLFFAQKSLCVLNINRNNIDYIRDLAALKELRLFIATDNRLQSPEVNMAVSAAYCSRMCPPCD